MNLKLDKQAIEHIIRGIMNDPQPAPSSLSMMDASPKIYYGENALDALAELPPGLVMLVCDPFMVQSGISKRVTDVLDNCGREWVVFSEVKPDPSVETVAECMEMVFEHTPDSLISLGGGSAIDTMKAALHFCLSYKELLMGRQHIYKPYFAAVPTTSGTGSEVTSYTVVTDMQNDIKIPLSDRCMIPDMAILDPEFTKTLPRDMIAYTGMDVLTHSLESYVCPKANTFTDMYATQAASMVLKYLPQLYGGSQDTVVHQQMMIASTLAGLAFNNSGLGVCHGLAHTIGAEFHIPHGKANSIILPYCIAYNSGLGSYEAQGREETQSRYATLGREFGLEGSDALVCKGLALTIRGLNNELGIKPGLKDNGVDRQAFMGEMQGMVKKVLADMTTKTNPRLVTAQDVEKLLTDIYEGKQPL